MTLTALLALAALIALLPLFAEARRRPLGRNLQKQRLPIMPSIICL